MVRRKAVLSVMTHVYTVRMSTSPVSQSTYIISPTTGSHRWDSCVPLGAQGADNSLSAQIGLDLLIPVHITILHQIVIRLGCNPSQVALGMLGWGHPSNLFAHWNAPGMGPSWGYCITERTDVLRCCQHSSHIQMTIHHWCGVWCSVHPCFMGGQVLIS
jgi:hypothetical protein